MDKKLLFSALLFIVIISCNDKSNTINNQFKSIEIQDKYIVVNFEESGFTGSRIEFRAKGKITADTANAGKDITVQITSPSQKVAVNPGSGYDITIVDLTSGAEKILYQKSDITTYLFYDEFYQNEALPANAEQAENLEPWKGKWIAAWKGGAAWNHSMNGSFRNLELKKEGDTEYLHFKASKTGNEDSTSTGSGIRTGGSKQVFYFTYGKAEFRARLKNQAENPTKGPFPALWLMPSKGDDELNPNWANWAAGGEIDIMEYVYKTPERIDQTIHVGEDGPNYDYSPGNQPITNIDEWHIYTLEWTKEGIYWYIDGVKGRDPYLKTNDILKYPFVDKSAFHIIMNVGVGRANNNGKEDDYPGGAQAGLETWMDVDWVKVSPNKDTILDNSRGTNGCEYYKDVQWE